MHRKIGYTSGVVLISLALLAAGCKRDPNVQKQKYLESGKRYEKDGKLREAVIQFSNALKVDHNYSDAAYELGKTYVEMGNLMAGYQQLMRAVDLNPSSIPARTALGALLIAGGAPDRAEAQAKAILAMQPNNADAYGLLASVAQRKGNQADALANIQHALAINPNQAQFHVALAIIENANGTAGPAAEQELQKAVSIDPKDASAHLVLASVLEKKGDRQGAEQQDLAAVQDAPKNLQTYLVLASFYMRAGNKDKAEQIYRQATEELSDTEVGAQVLKEYYQKTNQIDRAEQAYADLTAKHPKSVPLNVAYAQILMQKQEYAKAQSVADDLSKKNGSNPQVEVLNTVLLMKAGKLNDAFNLAQKAARNTPDNLQLQLTLAQAAAAKGDATAAQAAYQQAARIDPRDMRAQAGLARIANERRDFTTLAQIADKVIAAHPDYADAYLWKGTAEANQKQAGAEADFRAALKLSPNNAMASMELGQLLLVQQHVDQGKAMLEQALQHDPNLLPALDLLVAYDLAAKDTAKAQSRMEDQIAKSPSNSELYAHLAILQFKLKNFTGARDNGKKAMQLSPANGDGVEVYAQAESALGQPDDAIGTWQQWLNAHPGDARALTQIGMLEAQKGDASKAMEYYKKSLQSDPNQAIASNNLAYLMVENGQNVDVALSLAQSARQKMPNAPASADTLAWVYYYKGTYSSARDLLEDALKVDPNSASMHYHLGMVDSKLNDKAGAELHLKKAVSLAPNTQTAKQANDALSKLG